jgi:hypothetical protein
VRCSPFLYDAASHGACPGRAARSWCELCFALSLLIEVKNEFFGRSRQVLGKLSKSPASSVHIFQEGTIMKALVYKGLRDSHR